MNRRVVVTIATYKRPDLLEELLDSLEVARREHPFTAIIIDNDAGGSAHEVALRFGHFASYSVEPVAGIVAARNAALNLLDDETSHIAFVDDDETVPPHWMRDLMAAVDEFEADIVCGPVQSVFPRDAPAWVQRGGYIQRSAEARGVTSRSPATNNTLMSRRLLDRAGRPRFDESFSQTGGSDTEFFSRLKALDPVIVWIPEAAVSERVPLDRLTFKWIMRRYIRINNVSGRIILETTSRRSLAMRATTSILIGVPKTALALVRGQGLRLVDTSYITRGIGWWGAVRNRVVQEYARPDSQ